MNTTTNPNKIKVLLDSVTEVYADLFPNCYDNDKKLYKILKPYIRSVDVDGISEKKDHTFSISMTNFLSCINNSIGLNRWRRQYESTKLYDNIEDNIRSTLNSMTSVEVMYFYNVCPNLNNISFGVNISETNRPNRKVSDIFNPIPDAYPKGLVLRLRSAFKQDIVDEFNKYCITKGLLKNNVMVRNNIIEMEDVSKMFMLLANFTETSKIENIDKTIYNQLELFDNEVLSDVKITLVTDFEIE